MELTPSQRKAVEHKGSALVVANPGTGKTAIIAHRVKHLLKEGVKPSEILCVTFTKKAAEEMSQRLCEMKKGAESVDVKTFHSLAYDYLSSLTHIPEDLTSTNLLRYAILKEFRESEALNYESNYLLGTVIPKVENAIRFIKSFGILPGDIDAQTVKKLLQESGSFSKEELETFLGHFIAAYGRYEDMKRGGALDYTDLLIFFREEFPKKPKKFAHVIVDELQDMNRMEAEIAQMLTSDSLFLVGDRKQAIFGFQGGSVQNFDLFDFPHFVLSENWRSKQEILEYVRDFFLKHVPEHSEELKSIKSGSGAKNGVVKLLETENAEQEAVRLAVELGSATIIARTNYQIRKIEDLLKNANVEYTTTAQQSVESESVQDIIHFLRGLFNDEFLHAAALTSYSPIPINKALKKNPDLSGFERIRKEIKTKRDIYRLFQEHILPVAVSLGEREFRTAQALFSATREYFQIVSNPDFEGYIEYLGVASCNFEPLDSNADIVLTTVHKAKGRGFDNVIYVPSKGGSGLSLVDALVDAIMDSKNQESATEDEDRRIDFVAMTRAKKGLFIIASSKMMKTYCIPGIQTKILEEKATPLREPDRLKNAYAMFLAGDWDGASKLMNYKTPWLSRFIEDYFKSLGHLSFSTVSTKDPLSFFLWKMVRLSTPSPALKFGNLAHDIAENMLKNEPLKIKHEKLEENISACIDKLKKLYPGLEVVDTEFFAKVPLSELTDTLEPLNFLGYIDAVFRSGDKYILLDWKTDKKVSNLSKHKKQLAAYRRMFSRLKNIPEEKIDVGIGYIALRPAVNTGDFDYGLEFPSMSKQFERFHKDLKRVLDWKKDPNSFMIELLDCKENWLGTVVKKQLIEELELN